MKIQIHSKQQTNWIVSSFLLMILTLLVTSCGSELPSQSLYPVVPFSLDHLSSSSPLRKSADRAATITNIEDGTSHTPSDSCLSSFNTFAYDPDQKIVPNQRFFPLSPWQFNTTIPSRIGNDLFISDNNRLELVRLKNNHLEIWFFIEISLSSTNGEEKNGFVFVVYSPDTGSWRVVPIKVAQTDLSVYELFLLSDGSIWGAVDDDSSNQHSDTDKVPLLSRYNEISQQFEIPPGVGEITYEQLRKRNYYPNILLDSQDTFWIFFNKDGLYRYKVTGQWIEKQVDLPDTIVGEAAIAPDGIVYFVDENKNLYDRKLSPDMLVQFDPTTKKMSRLAIPQERWPIFLGMVVDNRGNLWLGVTGYRTRTGDWKSIFPDPDKYFAQGGGAAWGLPRLLSQSSNGLLWYSRYLDSNGRVEGTAWYNPRTGKGCLFTNYASEVIEDPLHRMWLVAEDRIFTYDLLHQSR